jgi:integrase
MKLTVRSTAGLKLPAGKTEAIFWDDEVAGFGLRLREGGSRSYVFQYKLGDKQRRMALGSTTAIDIGKARDTAKDLYARVRLGQDPAGEKSDAKVKASETLEAAIKLFLIRQRPRLKPRSFVEVERHLLLHAKPLHGLQFAKIERRSIATRLSEIAQASGSVTANRVRATLSALFAWGIEQGMVEHNVVIGTSKERERSRDRVLSPTELRLIWTNLGDDHFGSIVRLLMLTGARANEIAALRWSEVHDDMIVLPPERVKNGRTHIIPLTAAARAIIDLQPHRVAPDGQLRELIFGFGKGGFTGWGKCRKELNKRIAKAAGKPLPAWTPHDARRSFSTHANEIGIEPHIVEACLGHVSGFRGGVAAVYNKAHYETQKRTALERWAECLLSWAEGRESNVTHLKRGA